MKLLRRYKEPNSQWQETTMSECIEHTEGRGYWKEGTVKQLLEDEQIVWTPFATYKLETKREDVK